MLRPLAFLALLAAVAAGCAKKPAPAPDPDAPPDDTLYTIKVKEEHAGEKVAVTKTGSGTNITTVGAKSQTQREEQRFEYTETVHEVSPDDPKPTRVTREYKTARKTGPKGELAPLPYEGKTVEIRKAGKKAGYTFTAGGKPLPPAAAKELAEEFEKASGDKATEVMLPKTPVRVGQEWQADFAAIKALAGELPFALDKDKSTIIGRLLRAYKKDGQQWGVIEIRIRMVITPGGKGPSPSGTIAADATLDTPIDGSAHAGTTKMTMKGSLTAKDPKGGEVKFAIDGTQEKTVTPVK